MMTPYKPIDIDHGAVIGELIAAGVLDRAAFLQRYAASRPSRYHALGRVDWRRSNTLLKWSQSAPLRIARIVVFIHGPGSISLWHKDGAGIELALNLPWFGTSGTFTQWYCGDMPGDTLYVEGNDRCAEGQQHLPPTHSLEMTSPHLINVDHWHRVDSTAASEMRGLVSIRFDPPAHRLPVPKYEDIAGFFA